MTDPMVAALYEDDSWLNFQNASEPTVLTHEF
jgi:hypothetical protein